MNIVVWIRSKLYSRPQPRDDGAVKEVAEAAKRLNGHLQTYLKASDPLQALMIDLFAKRSRACSRERSTDEDDHDATTKRPV